MSTKVGVLGSGSVAKTLAAGFQKHGYDVKIGSRDPEKVSGLGLASGDFAQVASHADIVVLAVKGTAAVNALKLAGADHLRGKVVIDTTNPIAEEPPQHGVLRFFTGPNDSILERLQANFPEARFVKAWNSVGAAFMVNPSFPGGPPTMFIAGNDPAAKTTVTGILQQFGWGVEDMGFAEAARPIEALCQLWCAPGLLRNQWTHAFKLLKL